MNTIIDPHPANLTRIGVFYDGNYFFHVSNYYNYVHERQSRISIAGLHEFIRHKVADLEGGDYGFRHSQIVDAHYFRGRLSASEASQKGNQLYFDRVFDDILMSEGVTTHYLPVRTHNGFKQEKGIDVWLALEAFEQAFYKRFNVVVLIASDGDYTPLIRKLNTLGTRVMLLSWDFEYTDDYGNKRVTRTSQDLLNLVTYPIAMHEEINNRTQGESYMIQNLFVPKDKGSSGTRHYAVPKDGEEGIETSTILSLKSGYGFIKYPPNNLFFHFENVIGTDFSELSPGDSVQFRLAENERGEDVAIDVELIEGNEEHLFQEDYEEID
ncbi:MAG: NYN domain-containing protein [Bacteroidota bacterium]|nr:NYN domain-containing protein [Bacteroidota bacterium]